MRRSQMAGRMLTLGCVAGVAAAVAAGSAGAAATTLQSTISGGLTACNGDQISMTAKITIVYVSTTTPSGGSIQLTHQNLGDMVAVDQTTGTAYHGSGDPGMENTSIMTLPNGAVIGRTQWREVMRPAGGNGTPIIVTLLTLAVVAPDGTDRVSLTDPGGSADHSTVCGP